jgi:hypothetical protein
MTVEGTTIIDFEPGQVVNMLSASIAHHHATGHTGGGGGEDYSCDECRFYISDSVVIVGGPGLVLTTGGDQP